jgi:hypothetical protein
MSQLKCIITSLSYRKDTSLSCLRLSSTAYYNVNTESPPKITLVSSNGNTKKPDHSTLNRIEKKNEQNKYTDSSKKGQSKMFLRSCLS